MDVGHGSKPRTVMAIDGFRGRSLHLIARCIGTADVVAAVRFARDHDLEIAVRRRPQRGGHRHLRRRNFIHTTLPV